ncbi:MAG: hypothetical protein DRR08_05090 [Candidatus Parabeggiatoa sp. nov. 2]|nr:MAG: hypothetical protein B6247_03725 [Beggiatoa sp. 4572_84]RKZ62833.1 MAG: hypothetical protein DRR08_05090 [Gammaproteobacteria bacterium]
MVYVFRFQSEFDDKIFFNRIKRNLVQLFKICSSLVYVSRFQSEFDDNVILIIITVATQF